MTNKEAKKILEAYIACESRKAHFECDDYNCDDSCPLLYDMGTVGEYNEAINMGIKALEQKPKAVLYSGDGYADGHMVYDMAECPNCGYEYENGDKDWGLSFCPSCSQKLNWERSE